MNQEQLLTKLKKIWNWWYWAGSTVAVHTYLKSVEIFRNFFVTTKKRTLVFYIGIDICKSP